MENDMGDKELFLRLEEAGIDTKEALSRMMGNEALLMRILSKLKTDKNYDSLKEGLSKDDAEGAFAASHTLKGIYGNVSATELFKLFSEQTELLRSGDLEGGKRLMKDIEPLYAKLMEALAEL